ncbi:MAG: conjugal transfer protein TraH [Parvularcula sp.]|jgi:conjugative transfer pilus assembly protein TraH|nr:conjugal transfer protein TraH [Parvularcula sp.]
METKDPVRTRSWHFRLAGTALTVLASLGLATAPVQANVGNELNEFFDDMGAAANATGPVAYEGQTAGYYSGGNIWTRFPQKTVNLASLQLPSIKAGCGGIDVFSGSFSFINTDEIVAMLKATANNALGFAFQLAVKSISPQISATIEEMAQKVQQMNQFNMNSCELAQGLVGGLLPKSELYSSEICKAVGNSQGFFTDIVNARKHCAETGERRNAMAGNTDPGIPHESYNFTWKMLKDSYPSFSDNFREYLMNFVGTVIFVQDGNSDGLAAGYSFIPSGDDALLTAILDGSSSVRIYTCPRKDTCLDPTPTTVAIAANDALKPRVQRMITSMNAKIRTNTRLTDEEIALLGATSIPVYKILTVNAAATLGGLTSSDINELAETVAIDLLEVIGQRYYAYAQQGVSTFHNAPEEALSQWRDQITATGRALGQKSERLTDRLVRTKNIVDRAVFLESTLRNNVSPQMSAALAFSTSLSRQGVR